MLIRYTPEEFLIDTELMKNRRLFLNELMSRVIVEQTSEKIYKFQKYLFYTFLNRRKYIFENRFSSISLTFYNHKLNVVDVKTNRITHIISFSLDDIKNNVFNIRSLNNGKSVKLLFEKNDFRMLFESLPIYTKWFKYVNDFGNEIHKISDNSFIGNKDFIQMIRQIENQQTKY